MGHASDFVELEQRFQARTELSWAALENSLNQARETKKKKISAGWVPQTRVHVGDGLLDHYLGSSGTPGTRVKVKLVQNLGNLRVP